MQRGRDSWRMDPSGTGPGAGVMGQVLPEGRASRRCLDCDVLLAFQVQWPDAQASGDTFWGARMLLELSGGSLG